MNIIYRGWLLFYSFCSNRRHFCFKTGLFFMNKWCHETYRHRMLPSSSHGLHLTITFLLNRKIFGKAIETSTLKNSQKTMDVPHVLYVNCASRRL